MKQSSGDGTGVRIDRPVAHPEADPKKHGSQLFGHKIEKFCGKPDEIKKTIDSILISSEASEDIIYKQISYLENHGIEIYRLYHK